MTSGSSISASVGDPRESAPLPPLPFSSPPPRLLVVLVATEALLARRRSWLEDEDKPITWNHGEGKRT